MKSLSIAVESLPRILRRELDPGADILNGWDEIDIPPSPKLKKSERRISRTVEELRAKEDEDNSITSFYKSSALANPLLGSVELNFTHNNPAEVEKYERWIKPKLIKFLWIVREGLTISDASKLLGWDPVDVENWIKHNIYNLAVCVETARIEHKAFHVSRTNSASYGYQASCWMLERRYKDEYSKEVKITTKQENENSQIIKFGDREIHF